MMHRKTLNGVPKASLLRAALLAAAISVSPAAGFAGGGLAGGGEAAFVAGIEDLPLMDRLAEVPDAGVSFDKPEGRIVTLYAHGAVDEDEVRDFYRETLPQLGWEPAGRDTYLREGEALTVDFLGRDGDLTVRYTLQPQ